ncbi:hypothetical protein ACFYVR_17515 [Rhodococcus sp. NPDC003318]|uniref:hypothetical protein n=1 Tax=Rhodococcus sp. NPDC003318 TaxID=3364503 RepID=UPI00369E8353
MPADRAITRCPDQIDGSGDPVHRRELLPVRLGGEEEIAAVGEGDGLALRLVG